MHFQSTPEVEAARARIRAAQAVAEKAGAPIGVAEALSRETFAGGPAAATGPTRPHAPGPDRDHADRVAVKLADYLASKCDTRGTPLPLTNDDARLVVTRAMQLAGEYRLARDGRPT